ncbi:MAG: ATP-binding cassette domain-containing protein [Planctomycetes bacterium]|nr:ATP-binding cassette domain-containing protein [Planctomycetota bacterium]
MSQSYAWGSYLDLIAMADSSITLRGVNKSFGSTHAVRKLDLDVPRGSLCGFLGPNGAGKTTTIRMIMSIIYPDSGSIEVLGGNALKSKDRIGYLPEERGLYRKMRVGEFLQYLTKLKGVRRRDITTYIQQWLERIDLPDVYRKKCEELSKGMQQKVQFLAAILHEPELLILDEPFSGLDPVNTKLLNQLIRELQGHGTTIIFSTHVLHQAELICDRIFLINKGEKILDATLEEIRQRFDPRTIVAEPVDGEVLSDGIAGVQAVRRLPHSAAFELELESSADPQVIMQRILSQRPMRSVELRRLSLDEVFIQVVQNDVGSGAAELAREELSHV